MSSTPALPGALPRETSDAIRVARVLCILSMVSVHVWPGATEVLGTASPFSGLYKVMIEYLGRGSVPLLSLVSGVLLTVSARRYRAGQLVFHKAQALLYPMALWSALLLVLYVAHALATGDSSRLPHTTLGWLNSVFALTDEPVNLPLAFLRDVFVSAALGLACIALWRRSAALGCALLVAIAVVEQWTSGLLTLRPQILTFAFVGIALGMTGNTRIRPPWWLVLLSLAINVGVHENFTGEAVGYLNRVAMSLLIWRCALDLSTRQWPVVRGIRALEPHIFVIFCSHMITVAFVAVLGNALHLGVTHPWFVLVWLLQFPLIVLVGVLISTLGTRFGIRPLLVGARS